MLFKWRFLGNGEWNKKMVNVKKMTFVSRFEKKAILLTWDQNELSGWYRQPFNE
jgi:hypothetical protein